jgi:hypothetical protein
MASATNVSGMPHSSKRRKVDAVIASRATKPATTWFDNLAVIGDGDAQDSVVNQLVGDGEPAPAEGNLGGFLGHNFATSRTGLSAAAVR